MIRTVMMIVNEMDELELRNDGKELPDEYFRLVQELKDKFKVNDELQTALKEMLEVIRVHKHDNDGKTMIPF